jgi:cytoskeleton protein RodZ
MSEREAQVLDTLPVEGAPTAGKLPAPGAQLRAAREAQNLTAPDIASRLHLDLRIIEALEADRYEDLRAPAYVCGYLRSYGRQVGLDGDALVRAYESRSGATLPPPLHPFQSQPTAQTDTSHSGVRLAALAVVVAVLGLAFSWWSAHAPAPGEAPIVAELPPDAPAAAGQTGSADVTERPPETDAGLTVAATGPQEAGAGDGIRGYTPPEDEANAAAPTGGQPDGPVTGESAPGGAPVAATTGAPGITPAAPETARAEAAAGGEGAPTAADAGEAVAPPPVAGQVSITIGLSAQSWVEVYDANDRRLFFNMASAGQTIATRGAGPLRVIIGNIRAARLSVEGRDIPLLPLARDGVARLQVTEAGAEPLPRPAR